MNTTPRRSPLSRAAMPLLLAFMAMPAADARAQNALGGGDALDANPRIGSGGRNTRGRSFNEELAFRNSIVTGNVAGGKQFRGDVGYTSPFEFRGATGSNDQFAFRADAFYSGLATRNIRGIDALRQQLQFTTFGQTSGPTGPLIINRPATGISAASLDAAGARPVADLDRLDGSLRSISAIRVRSALEPELLARYVNEAGDTRLVTGSEIEGVRLRMDNLQPERPGPSERPAPSDPPTRVDRSRPGAEMVDSNLSPHALMIESLRRETERAGARIRELPAQEEEPAELRPPTPEGDEGSRDLLDALQPSSEPVTIEQMLELMRRNLGAERGDAQPDTEDEAEAEKISALERALREIGADLPPQPLIQNAEQGDDRYLSHMTRGQQMLAEGQWFDAEERFTMALALRPGDAMAAAGRIHAQIGAGMFRSAAINIRNLYGAYPELIPVRYEAALLPQGDRLELVKRQLVERARLDTSFAVDAALVMAYLGHQIDDPALMDAGFARLREVLNAIGAEQEPLFELMEQVWSR